MFKTSECGVQKKVSELQVIIVRLLALLAFATAAPWACAQAPAQPASQTVDFSANVDEVSLDLVVHDKKNRPVLDLKEGDIAVTDNGAAVPLKSLRLVSGEQPSERLITLVFDRPGQLAGKTQESDPTIMKNTRDAAEKILKLLPEKDFSISVLSVEGRLRLQAGFTSDRQVLEKAVNEATRPVKELTPEAVSEPEKQLVAEALTGVSPSGKAAGAKDRALALTLLSALKDSARIAQNQHIRPFLAGLLALAQSQQQITQRKALIFFTSFGEGHFDLRSNEAITSIIGSANQAGESIYVIDLNSSSNSKSQVSVGSYAATGLGGDSGKSTSGTNALGHAFDNTRPLGYLSVLDNANNNDSMKSLAEGTGGSYIDQSRFQKSLGLFLQDMTTYYVAIYDPQIKEYDGKFRPVAVKPLRAGLKIRTQSGYLALPPHSGAGAKPQPFELPLLKILAQSPLPADVPFHAAILNMGDQPEGTVSTVAIETPYSSLEIHDDPNTEVSSASLSILAVVTDQSGMVIERFSEDIPRRRIAKKSEMDSLGVISFLRNFNAPPGQYILETAVVDHNSGKAGAQRMTFEVRSSTGAPSLSNLLLVRKTESSRSDDDSADPLRHGNDRVTPNLTGQLQPGAKEVSVFFTAHSDPHAVQAASLILQVFLDGKQMGGQPMLSHPGSGQEFSSYLSRFSISTPQDGVYEVKAILTQGGKSAESSTFFTLMGTTAALASDAPAVGSSLLPPHPVGPLKITFPPNPSGQPTPDEINSILADAAKYAMAYKDSLPNFMCEQVTDRSVNLDGTRKWTHKDKVTELLTFFEGRESRIRIDQEVKGSASNANTDDAKGVASVGEFGVTLSGLFRPASKANFQWKQTGILEDGAMQVFDYRVARENSTFILRGSSLDIITVGYHGQVFIDSATRSVRRIMQVVDDVPEKYPIQGASVSVDYDYVVINGHDYMLPIGAQVITKTGRWELDLNDIEFRNFHRFGSTTKIVDYSPVADTDESHAPPASHRKHGDVKH